VIVDAGGAPTAAAACCEAVVANLGFLSLSHHARSVSQWGGRGKERERDWGEGVCTGEVCGTWFCQARTKA
jgi:hypothetical protein